MTLSKKPADQQAQQPGTDAVTDDEIDLAAHADEDGDEDGDDDEDGSDGGTGVGTGTQDIASIVSKAVTEALAAQARATESEIDRRINGALTKQRKAPAGDDGAGAQTPAAAPAADIRGARLAFREYLPSEMKFLSTEERKMATEYGMSLLKVAAAEGFTDEDTAGKKAAEQTALFFQKSRQFYSKRTKDALAKQGALKQQGGGQTGGGTATTPDVQASAANAAERRQRLFGQTPQK